MFVGNWCHEQVFPKLVPQNRVSETGSETGSENELVVDVPFSVFQMIGPTFCIFRGDHTDLAEEKRNWEMALTKARQAHTNMSKLQLTLMEATTSPPKDDTHKAILLKLAAYNEAMLKKVQDYSQIVTQHTIPDLGEPTTTGHLRTRLVQELGVSFCCYFHFTAV